MFKGLRQLWNDALGKTPSEDRQYVVYAARPHVVTSVLVPKTTTDAQIHATIASYESKSAKRDYTGVLQPGSFNFVRIEAALDSTDAATQAKAMGLKHEPIKVVLSRNVEAARQRQEELAAVKPHMDFIDRMIKGHGPF